MGSSGVTSSPCFRARLAEARAKASVASATALTAASNFTFSRFEETSAWLAGKGLLTLHGHASSGTEVSFHEINLGLVPGLSHEQRRQPDERGGNKWHSQC